MPNIASSEVEGEPALDVGSTGTEIWDFGIGISDLEACSGEPGRPILFESAPAPGSRPTVGTASSAAGACITLHKPLRPDLGPEVSAGGGAGSEGTETGATAAESPGCGGVASRL